MYVKAGVSTDVCFMTKHPEPLKITKQDDIIILHDNGSEILSLFSYGKVKIQKDIRKYDADYIINSVFQYMICERRPMGAVTFKRIIKDNIDAVEFPVTIENKENIKVYQAFDNYLNLQREPDNPRYILRRQI